MRKDVAPGRGPPPIQAPEHRTAILDAEAGRHARPPVRYGVLTRWQLAKLPGARLRQRGRFQRALDVRSSAR